MFPLARLDTNAQIQFKVLLVRSVRSIVLQELTVKIVLNDATAKMEPNAVQRLVNVSASQDGQDSSANGRARSTLMARAAQRHVVVKTTEAAIR
jgi:hypothetical protein